MLIKVIKYLFYFKFIIHILVKSVLGQLLTYDFKNYTM